jgi:hypothetical protein
MNNQNKINISSSKGDLESNGQQSLNKDPASNLKRGEAISEPLFRFGQSLVLHENPR